MTDETVHFNFFHGKACFLLLPTSPEVVLCLLQSLNRLLLVTTIILAIQIVILINSVDAVAFLRPLTRTETTSDTGRALGHPSLAFFPLSHFH